MGLVFLTSPALAGGYMVPRQKLGYSPGIRKWMGGRGTITMSLNVADILLKFDMKMWSWEALQPFCCHEVESWQKAKPPHTGGQDL